jgi:RNA polymerase sigma-70 factor (ECF subfamily)
VEAPRYPEIKDEELMARAQTGDRAAFAELVFRYEKPLYGYLRRLLRHDEAAEDAFQETWYRILKAVDRFNPEFRFAPWLYRIATNLCRDAARRGKLRNHRSLDQPLTGDSDTTLGELTPGAELAPDLVAEGSDVGTHVARFVGELPDKQREAFVLRHYQGLTYEEIARAQRCSLAAVKSNIHHAVVSLRRSLDRIGLTPATSSS